MAGTRIATSADGSDDRQTLAIELLGSSPYGFIVSIPSFDQSPPVLASSGSHLRHRHRRLSPRQGRDDPEAVRIVHEAIDAGINFLDNAWEYHDGESEDRMGRAIADRRDSVFLMTKVCTHGRDAKVAMRQLEQSLRRLRTDHLDLWQIHECVYDNDPDRHFAKGGVVEALERAKAQGKVRYVGFTGHKDPEIHLRMLSLGFPFDACQLPLNGFDAHFRSFQSARAPRARAPEDRRDRDEEPRRRRPRRQEEGGPRRRRAALRDEPAGLHDRLGDRFAAGAAAEPQDRARLHADVGARAARVRTKPRQYAADGRFELYKTTAEHEGEVGRAQHGFPSQEEVAMIIRPANR